MLVTVIADRGKTMSDPFGFFGLLAIGLFAFILGAVGLQRGKVVAIFRIERQDNPLFFWYGIAFQLGLGAVCLILAGFKASQ